MLVLVVLTLVCGLGVGLARGGTLGALARVHVYRPWLFAVLVLVLAVGGLVPALHSPAWIVAAVLAALFAGMNNRLPGLGLLLAGIIANAAAVTANGGQMPVSLWGARHAGVPVGDILASAFHTPGGGGTSLRLLSDIIPFPFPGVPAVVSIGDVAIAAALGVFGAVTPVRARRTLLARRNAALAGALPTTYGDLGRAPTDDPAGDPDLPREAGDPVDEDAYDAFDADTYDSDDDYEAGVHDGAADAYYDDLGDRDLDDRGLERPVLADDGLAEGEDGAPGDGRVDPVPSLDAERDHADGDGPASRSVTARRRGLAR